MKRFLAVLLAVLMLVSVVAIGSAEEAKGADVKGTGVQLTVYTNSGNSGRKEWLIERAAKDGFNLAVLEEGFKEFFEKEVPGNPLKAEYLIPIFIGQLLEQGKMFVKVLKTNDTWYGMTYHEDVVAVKDSFKKMLENGVYKADLFSDL